ncbi:TspO/MBR related protein [Hoeflea halophila]|uniref:TspO/MBR related protein n=1 Tax=Hoeflea halophila TaxID=714899 RepID=A0A286I9K5_9HYPH|nr:TspO/MBR family protein [Hoeflea halophila]SOE16741.1 TspO/MBR related protein [Hoeflea halophila]
MSAIIIALLVLAVASTGAMFKPGEWYRGLVRPPWTPPDRAFPVVWTILYIAIGVSGWLVWQDQGAGFAMALWLIQLVLNAAWSWLFFGRHRMDLAFADICLLLLAIVAYIAVAGSISPLAALLFVPYAAWVVLAAALNRAVWRLNKDANASPSN